MQQFTVIAGPNGAGKSTFSARMSKSGTLIFDPDLEKRNIERQYPDISDDAIEAALTRKYHNFELKAIAGQKPLTVETNLRNDFLAVRAGFFKGIGYQTRLVFMLLPNIESSMDRVNLRVKQKGHFVDAESIRLNFKKSLENLYRIAPLFDQFMLVCAAANYGIISQPELLLTVKDGNLVQTNTNIPEWALPIVENLIRVAFNIDINYPNHPGFQH